MSSPQRIAVVIQGPLVSTGNSGSGAFVKEFDCTDNIRRMVRESVSLVAGFVLSTWRGTCPILDLSKLRTLELDDPGPQKTHFSREPNNELRQAYGCHEGVKLAMAQFAPDYILKVRTDQYLDIPRMVEHMLTVDATTDAYLGAGQQGYLYFPNMISWTPYSVGDFYVGGHARDMLRFFEAQVTLSRHSFVYVRPWVHADFMFRHAYHNLRGKFGLSVIHFFPNITPSLRLDLYPPPARFRYHPEVLRLWSEMLTHSVCLFPRDIATRMEWRGQTFQLSSHSSGEFYEEWSEAQTDPSPWLQRRLPGLYAPSAPLSPLQRFLNFNSEKAVEMAQHRPVFRRHLYRTARFLLSFLTGNFPREDFALKLWLKLRRRH